jgi:hypothetical protein
MLSVALNNCGKYEMMFKMTLVTVSNIVVDTFHVDYGDEY